MNTSKNKLILVAVVAALAILSAAAWQLSRSGYAGQRQRQELSAALSQQFAAQKNGELAVIELAAITPFAWEKLFLFRPYSTSQQIQAVAGVNAASIKTNIAENDGIVLFVFVAGGEVVQYLDFPRQPDLAALANPSGYSPAQAVFVLDEKGNPALKAP